MTVSGDQQGYRLLYFNIKGRGELLRCIFHAAGQPFEDNRIDASNWASLKHQTPLSTLPVLEIDGLQIAQTMTIARFLADAFGLRGENNYEQALIDSIAETADDLLADYLNFSFIGERDKSGTLKRKFVEETLPTTLGNLDKFQKTHSAEYGYIFGKKLTYADLAMYNVLDQLITSGVITTSFLQKYKYVTELRKRILTHGHLTKYFNNRPRTTV